MTGKQRAWTAYRESKGMIIPITNKRSVCKYCGKEIIFQKLNGVHGEYWAAYEDSGCRTTDGFMSINRHFCQSN
ncbi:MAG: hypothetical protein WC332_00975 [Clostridia bacterium]|jgi:hypothetical protein